MLPFPEVQNFFYIPEKVYMILELQLKYKFLLYLVIFSRCGDDIAEQRKGSQWKVILPTTGTIEGGGGSGVTSMYLFYFCDLTSVKAISLDPTFLNTIMV